MKRVSLSPQVVELVTLLRDQASVNKSSEIVNNGVSLLIWAVEQTRKGRTIGAVHPKTGEIETFSMPLLDKIKVDKDGKEA